MNAPNVTVSVVLMVGDTRAKIGTIDVPLTTTSSTVDGGSVNVSIKPDMPGLLADLAGLLHEAANEITKNAGVETKMPARLALPLPAMQDEAGGWEQVIDNYLPISLIRRLSGPYVDLGPVADPHDGQPKRMVELTYLAGSWDEADRLKADCATTWAERDGAWVRINEKVAEPPAATTGPMCPYRHYRLWCEHAIAADSSDAGQLICPRCEEPCTHQDPSVSFT